MPSPASFLFILFALLLFLVFGIVISILFFFQRKPWQRIIACLSGATVCLFGYTGMLNHWYSPYDRYNVYNLWLELAGFTWMVFVIMLPKKTKGVTGTSTPEDQTGQRVKAISAVFLIQLLFSSIAFGAYNNYSLFSEKWELNFFNYYVMLLVFFVSILLFYFKRMAGWLLLSAFFIYKTCGSLSYILWLIYVQRSQTQYHVGVSAFSFIYCAYYFICLCFLFTENNRIYFNIRKKQLFILVALTALFGFAVFSS